MKWIIVKCVVIVLVGVVECEVLSLEDCIRIAKQNNFELALARNEIEKANLSVVMARSANYPNVSIQTGARRSGNEFTTENSYSTSLSLSYPIFKGGYDKASIEIAKLRLSIEEENYRAKESSIIFEIKTVFYKIVQKEEELRLIDKIIERRKNDLVLIQLRYQAGRENLPSVEEAQTNLLQAELNKEQTESELNLAKGELNILLGRSADEELILTMPEINFSIGSLETLIDTALKFRTELKVQECLEKISTLELEQAKSKYYPDLTFSFSYGLGGREFLDQKRSWTAGVSLGFNIFDGFSREARIRSGRVQLGSRRLEMDKLKLSIAYEIKQAYYACELGLKELEISEKSLSAKREIYDLTRLQYENGKTSYFFLQQKENELTQAEYNVIRSKYKLLNAFAALEKAVGKP